MLPRLEPCRIYVHTANRNLAAQHVPTYWPRNQYAVELWLQQALEHHPWRVSSIDEADLVAVSANFSLMCAAGKAYQRRLLWDEVMAADALSPNRTIPTFIPLQYGGCAEPWVGATPAPKRRKRPKNAILLLDLARRKGADRRNHSIVSPFLVGGPPQLLADGLPSWSAAAWAERKLLFFAGHTPKLYLNPLRYQLWRQLRRDARVTLLSSTLACTVGAFAACRMTDEALNAMRPTFFTSFCHKYSASHCGSKGPPFSGSCGGSLRNSPKRALAVFRKQCAAFSAVNFDEELPMMLRDTRRLQHNEYIAETLTHRFCRALCSLSHSHACLAWQ